MNERVWFWLPPATGKIPLRAKSTASKSCQTSEETTFQGHWVTSCRPLPPQRVQEAELRPRQRGQSIRIGLMGLGSSVH